MPSIPLYYSRFDGFITMVQFSWQRIIQSQQLGWCIAMISTVPLSFYPISVTGRPYLGPVYPSSRLDTILNEQFTLFFTDYPRLDTIYDLFNIDPRWISFQSQLLFESQTIPRRPRLATIEHSALVGDAKAQSQSPLFRLPTEIRVMIWQALCYRHVLQQLMPQYLRRTTPTRKTTALLQTCKWAYAEAMPIFFKRSEFVMNNAGLALTFLREIGPAQTQYLRSIVLGHWFRASRAASKNVVTRLSKTTTLKKLEFTVDLIDYVTYMDNRADPSKWHPVCAIHGLKEVKVNMDAPFDELEDNGVRYVDFCAFRANLRRYLLGQQVD